MPEPSDTNALSDKLMAELLTAFAASQYWTNLTDPGQIAAEIIRQHLTVQFHAYIQARLNT